MSIGKGLWFFENLAQEVKLAMRMMRRSPVFTAAAVISLGLGIGANAAIFRSSMRCFYSRSPSQS